jgi:protein-tyrosine phosphatase
MFELIAIPMAIATVCALGYMGSRILLFGLVKPEDVESDLPIFGPPSGNDKVLPERKPVARSLPSHFQRVASKSPGVQSSVMSYPPVTQAIGALACQSFMTVLPAMDCDRVTCNLLVGSYPLDSKEVEELRSVGITAILSLQTDEDLGERGIEWERKAALAANLTFRSVPVRDFDTADLERKLPNCVVQLDRMLQAGHTVYLHCTAGAGRSPTVAAAYLHWCLAWPLERALAHVREVRDCSPNAEAIRRARWPRIEL